MSRINSCSHCKHKYAKREARCFKLKEKRKERVSNLKFGFLLTVSFVTLQITGIVSPIFALGHVVSSRVVFAKKYDKSGNPITKGLQKERIKKIKSDRLSKASLAAFNSIPVLGPAALSLGLMCTFTLVDTICGLANLFTLQKKHKNPKFISELGLTIRASAALGTAF